MITLAAQLAAAVALLIWSTRLIRTGVERAFMPELKSGLKKLSGNSVLAAAGGSLSAMVLQSATAVALVSAGFAVSGMLAAPTALAVLLGAELGSAFMAQVLILPMDAALPFLLLVGVVTFFKAQSRKAKQLGRILTGLALVFLSLGMIREATASVGNNEIVQAISAYFNDDLPSAFAVGAILTWAMHSSLAAVLTFATFAASGLIAAPVAAALVIGANLGGALIPFALLWGNAHPARLMVMGNLLARGAMSLAFLVILINGLLPLAWLGTGPAQQAVALHILLNTAVLLFTLPMVSRLVGLVDKAIPRHSVPDTSAVSALDPNALDHPPLALACAQRELLRMLETVQATLLSVMHLFRSWDPERARVIERLEDDIDRMHFETKIYVSRLREGRLDARQDKKTLDLVAVANNLEEAADRIAVNLVGLAKKMSQQSLTFSPEGLADIADFHDQIATNGQLALGVLTTGDAEAARQLVEEKDRIRIEEQNLQERHLKRLQDGTVASIETTNIHQEVLRLFKQVNAALTYVAYPIAEETGDLLDSRLAHRRIVRGQA